MADVGVDELLIDVGGALELRVEQPNERGDLQHVVERNEAEDEACELVGHCEEAEDHPVSQPLLVVARLVGLQGVETHEHGVGHADEIGDNGLSDAENNEKHEEDQGVLEDVLLGDTGHSGDLVENSHICVIYYL